MTPEHKARFHAILDEYDTAMQLIGDADECAIDTTVHARELLLGTQRLIIEADAILSVMRKNLTTNKRIMDANRRANDQVRILLNEM